MAIPMGTVELWHRSYRLRSVLNLSLKWNTRLSDTNLQMKTTFLCEFQFMQLDIVHLTGLLSSHMNGFGLGSQNAMR